MATSGIPEASLNTFRAGLSRFVMFTEPEWTALKTYLKPAILKKKDHFAVHGKVCDHMGFIINGSVRYYHVKDGLEITGYFSFENEFVSSYKSFLKQQPSITYIQALEQTELVVISYKNMQLMLNNPALAFKMERFGRLVAEHYICCYEERITSFIIQTPEERYTEMLKNEGNIMLRVPQHYIANFLGITPVSLSRIRKRTLASC
ncbi:Cyclic nucleotide-binding domain protein [compost metagenome]